MTYFFRKAKQFKCLHAKWLLGAQCVIYKFLLVQTSFSATTPFTNVSLCHYITTLLYEVKVSSIFIISRVLNPILRLENDALNSFDSSYHPYRSCKLTSAFFLTLFGFVKRPSNGSFLL
jgi:hypothetical protein